MTESVSAGPAHWAGDTARWADEKFRLRVRVPPSAAKRLASSLRRHNCVDSFGCSFFMEDKVLSSLFVFNLRGRWVLCSNQL
ncbi:Hypothetical predicted protein [Podarcis lilfordi]|uniref:Uncharacterized protein n=1 Tax=Podarcis lilfordi TaxID=74358 RepID=A0AA35LAD5_9SAUR|nr:Hypothetical predicted protein [Podarcis lilfordi]